MSGFVSVIGWEGKRASMCCGVIVSPVAAASCSSANLHHALFLHPAVKPIAEKVLAIHQSATFKHPAVVII